MARKSVREEISELKRLREVVLTERPLEELEHAHDSLLTKLSDRIQFLESLYHEDEVRLKTPAMAILKVSHVFNQDSKYYFGSDIATQSEVMIEIFGASLDKTSGKPIKEGLLHKLILTEKQFADTIVNANCGDGKPVTLVMDTNRDIEEYDISKDATKLKMQKMRDGVNRGSNQTDRFVREMQSQFNAIRTKGRASKKDVTFLINRASMLPGHSVSNSSYMLEEITKETNNRINEVGINMHFSVNQYAAIHGYPMLIEDTSIDTKALDEKGNDND